MEKLTITPQTGKQLGRLLFHDEIAYLTYSASEIGFYYSGERIFADIITDEWRNDKMQQGWVGVFVNQDSEPWKRFALETEEAEYLIFDREKYARFCGISPGELPREISVRIAKFSEMAFGMCGIRYLLVDDKETLRPLPERKKKIEFIGDSITCGYGIEGVWNVDVFNTPQENPYKNYALRTAKALEADYQLVSWSGIGLITDWIPPERDTPDETVLIPQIYPYTAYTLSKKLEIEPELWNASRFKPDLVVIHLGTNDDSYTREKPEREQAFVQAYKKLYDTVRKNYGDVQIVCCLGLMVRTLCPVIANMVQKLQQAGDPRVHYLKFDGQKPEDGIASDWHPSETTHKKAAEKLTEFCRELLDI